ncbi:EKC/KEOPS complex subunit Cgi121p [Diutina catenulata]
MSQPYKQLTFPQFPEFTVVLTSVGVDDASQLESLQQLVQGADNFALIAANLVLSEDTIAYATHQALKNEAFDSKRPKALRADILLNMYPGKTITHAMEHFKLGPTSASTVFAVAVKAGSPSPDEVFEELVANLKTAGVTNSPVAPTDEMFWNGIESKAGPLGKLYNIAPERP